MQILNSIGQALFTSFSMFWEILWPLILGFTLSAIVQYVVSHNAMAKTLGCEGPRCLTFATLYGIASSSCSYAVIALARSIFQKGASFIAALAFELASTYLVIELGIILFVTLRQGLEVPRLLLPLFCSRCTEKWSVVPTRC